MLATLLKILGILIMLEFSKATVAPPVTKCRAEDSVCHKANAVNIIPTFAAGIPELGIEVLDPAYFEFVDCSKLNLKFYMNESRAYGLKDCQPVDIHRDVRKSKLFIKLSCSIIGHGQYELSGTVLALDVRGRGPLHVNLRRFEIASDLDLQEIDINGKKHFNITNYKYTFDLIEKSDVVFENLFEGNKALSTAAAEVIKKSGNEIVREIGDPMFDAATRKVIKNINIFFHAIPKEELVID